MENYAVRRNSALYFTLLGIC